MKKFFMKRLTNFLKTVKICKKKYLKNRNEFATMKYFPEKGLRLVDRKTDRDNHLFRLLPKIEDMKGNGSLMDPVALDIAGGMSLAMSKKDVWRKTEQLTNEGLFNLDRKFFILALFFLVVAVILLGNIQNI